ncbi:alpha/beta hydrolase [Pseudomonas coleopterorum]|uniref:Alpha/beta hydrolase n=1 Tax=Pseudomonas coleopterorum TaxID=1605838 RepID=A0AAJ6M1I7_9PSED|nr:alpha/beta hydrolase [Pseudomonas coleopterorum]WNC10605.1 alpha/beta hydrolase [Pseudomonas coleopterorum]
MKHTIISGLAMAALISHGAAQARPDPQQTMVAPALERPDTGYGFTTRNLDSADGQRHYRLYIGRPDQPAPAAGYPVVYLLDGNAAVGALDQTLLRRLNEGADAPLIVAIGSTTPLRIDRPARTFDYTPRVTGDTQIDAPSGLPSGGADQFLDLLDQRIKPLVEHAMPVDVKRQTLWGHSYGGLLVLHALLTRPGAFQHYAAASPSLWWGNGAVLEPLDGLAGRVGQSKVGLTLMRGDAEAAGPGGLARSTQAPGVAMERLLKGVRGVPSLRVDYHVFPGLGHGPMLPASLHYILENRVYR